MHEGDDKLPPLYPFPAIASQLGMQFMCGHLSAKLTDSSVQVALNW